MAGTFSLGEKKVRPGVYYHFGKKGGNPTAGALNGVVAVVFRADFGPTGKVVELGVEDGYENTFGTGLTTDAIREAFNGGATTILAARLGSDGTAAEINLNGKIGDADASASVKITAKYVGDKKFTATVRTKLTDSKVKQVVIYTGTTAFETFEIDAGTDEAKNLVDVINNQSKNFSAEVVADNGSVEITLVNQQEFTAGTNPVVTNADYSVAFSELEPYEFNAICVDTEETSVHTLLHSFINRIFNAGSLCQAVVAEKHTVALEDRETHAVAFNDEKMNYVLNSYVETADGELEGYQVAARVAGMIGSCNSGTSLTHTVITGVTDLKEKLTNTEMTNAEKRGCIVLSTNQEKQIWIDNAINTLITPSAEQDDGWKKIRRVKTRFEFVRRINATTDKLVGKLNNDNNGRNTIIQAITGIGGEMIAESKLMQVNAEVSSVYIPTGDSAWFNVDVVDLDSMEHIYFLYRFQFDTNVSAA